MPLGEYEVPLDFTHDTPDDLEGNDPLVPEGRHHVIIVSVKREGEKANETPCLRFRYRILAGPAAGLVASERFHISEDAKKRLKILAARLGLAGDSPFGRQVTPDFGRAVGRELVVEVKQETYPRKKDGVMVTASKWDFANYYPPEDPRAGGCPVNPEAAKAVRASLGAAAPVQRQAQPAQPRQTTLPGVMPAAGAYDDV